MLEEGRKHVMERPTEPTTEDRAVALYHVVYAHETFEEAVKALVALVQNAEDKRLEKSRRLFLDIEGHRNEHGGFDDDMRELQQGFLTTFLSRYLSEIHLPLCQLQNANPQDNVIPPELRMEDRNS
jgi:hypothetical protein